MGGFFYADKGAVPDSESVRATAREQFRQSGFAAPIAFDTDSYIVDYYPKIDYPGSNHVSFGDGNFILTVGTFIYRDRIGADALRLFYEQADYAAELRTSRGHFLILLRKGAETFLFKDPLGSYELFLTRDRACASTSFLAAAAVAGRCTINVQEAYEYVFNGVSLGTATPFAEVRRLGLFERMNLEPKSEIVRQDVRLDRAPDCGSLEEICDRNLSGLLDYAKTLTQIFGDNIRVALSGGYDSRFLLALFRHVGTTPRLFVYGDSGDSDVRTAESIAKGEGIALNHVNKSLLRRVTAETYANIVEQNFRREDALPNGGIFNSGSELIARTWRNENGALHVNGGGGEVFRNFFNLTAGRRLTPRQFVWVFYRQIDPSECTSAFVAKNYDEIVARKVGELFGAGVEELTRLQIEQLYPYFRCRSWFGRENSINSRWGHSILPFFDHQTVDQALRIPILYKNFGDFEAMMIRRADPALARYNSNYGFSFAENAPVSARVASIATYLRPPWLRRNTFRLRSWLEKRQPRPDLLSKHYLEGVIDPSFPFMARYFQLDKVRSELQFARICTLEYLFHRLSAQTP